MQFENLNDLLIMGGHGTYVWSAYLIMFVTIFLLFWVPLSRKRRFFKQQKRLIRREQYQAEQQNEKQVSRRSPAAKSTL